MDAYSVGFCHCNRSNYHFLDNNMFRFPILQFSNIDSFVLRFWYFFKISPL